MYLFEVVLVSLTALTGLVWLADKLFLRKKRTAKAGLLEQDEPMLVDYSRAFFPILLLVLLLRSFVAEPFRIPSGSMMPTLLIGDFILVNKFSYGLRLPVTNQKVLSIGAPERGDVVVFHFPGYPCRVGDIILRSGDGSCQNPSTPVPVQHWVKRVIGLPGDVVRYENDVLSINGEPLQYQSQGVYVGSGRGVDMSGMLLLEETLSQHAHQILESPMRYPQGEWEVPEGHYFVMGDNRDNSEDGRYWGFLPEENLRGKAFLVLLNTDGGLSFSRMGTKIR